MVCFTAILLLVTWISVKVLAAEPAAQAENYVKDSEDQWGSQRDAMPGQEVGCRAVFYVRGGEEYIARGRLSSGLEYIEVDGVWQNGVPVNASYCTVVTRWQDAGSAFSIHFSPLFAPGGTVRLEIRYTVRYTGPGEAAAAVELADSRGETLSGPGAGVRSYKLTLTRGVEVPEARGGSNPLTGAGFCLYRDQEGQKRLAFVPISEGGYMACTGYGCGHSGHEYLLTTPENGTIELSGLSEGTYYLREERTPAGHRAAADMLKISVSGAGEISAGGALLADGRLVLLEKSAAAPAGAEKNQFLAFFETGSKLLAACLAVMIGLRRHLFC